MKIGAPMTKLLFTRLTVVIVIKEKVLVSELEGQKMGNGMANLKVLTRLRLLP